MTSTCPLSRAMSIGVFALSALNQCSRSTKMLQLKHLTWHLDQHQLQLTVLLWQHGPCLQHCEVGCICKLLLGNCILSCPPQHTYPQASRTLGIAPLASNKSTMYAWPCRQARCRALMSYSPCWLTSTPWYKRRSTSSLLPSRDEVIKGDILVNALWR